jgi:dihydrodipicolinate synthase/N-acetylneuraminate lyase
VYRYTANNVRFVRRATHKPVHLIAGMTDRMSRAEQAAAARAARDAGAIGASLYKYPLYSPGSWEALTAFDGNQP